jgi:hypothetical protein
MLNIQPWLTNHGFLFLAIILFLSSIALVQHSGGSHGGTHFRDRE